MKATRQNKLLGIAIGERSMLVAEVSAGDKPSAKHLAEFEYPPGVTLEQAANLGSALAEFLQTQQISARHVVIGLPARWLLVKNKELPPVDSHTAADLLRLGAETDFSSELKDLVFDYVGEADPATPQTVLLIATPRKYVEWVAAMCEAGKLTPLALTSSAAVLGAMTQGQASKNTIVLAVACNGAEFVAHRGEHASVLRHLRAPEPAPLFLSELRRAVSSVSMNGSASELVVWDGAGLEADRFNQMDLPVRYGDLPNLGVIASNASSNGAGRKYGAAVALAAAGLSARALPMDFLHSRLAPPPVRRVERWMVWTGAAVLLLIGLIVYAYWDMQNLQRQKTDLSAQLTSMQPHKSQAQDFVSKVTFAERWEASDPRYVACLRDITELLPSDGMTYVTALNIKEKEPKNNAAAKPNTPLTPPDRSLLVTLSGEAPSQERALELRDAFLGHSEKFEDVRAPKLALKNALSRYGSPEVAFTITFTFKVAPLKD